MSFNADEVEKRLKTLETKLISLQGELLATEKIAKQLQSLVTQNRFPEVQGIEFLSRYIPGEQSRAEGFDFFLNSKKTTLWFFYFSVQSYGLSTALFQSYLLLQSRAFFEQNNNTPENALSSLLKEFSTEKEDPTARVFIASIQLSTLKWQEAVVGTAPTLFFRKKGTSSWSTPEPIDVEDRKDLQLSPATRLYFLNQSQELNKIKGLNFPQENTTLKEDFNSALFQLEKNEKKTQAPQDICFWSLEISAKKIHLA
jgi:sigma-B regulation protein RsbU (phosphoserine phosphatase)